jgi:hypothetical protein
VRVRAQRYSQTWPLKAASGRYLGQLTTTGPAPTPTGAPTTGAVLSIAQIISQVNPGHAYPDDTTMTEAISGGQLTPAYNTTSECGAAIKGPSKAGTIEAAIGTSTTAVGGKLLALNPIVGGVVMAAGGILDLIGAITAHHAQAVTNEQTILCQAVPAANAALAQVMTDVQSGTYSAAQGAQYLAQIVSAFKSAVAPITKSCNEACGLTKELEAIAISMTQQLSQISVSAGGAPVSLPGIGSVPIWALLAAGVAAFFLFAE